MLPLQVAGAPELVIILLVVVLLAVPALLVTAALGVYFLFVRDGGSDTEEPLTGAEPTVESTEGPAASSDEPAEETAE